MTTLDEYFQKMFIGREFIEKDSGKKYKTIKISEILGSTNIYVEYEDGRKGNVGLKYHLDDKLVE